MDHIRTAPFPSTPTIEKAYDFFQKEYDKVLGNKVYREKLLEIDHTLYKGKMRDAILESFAKEIIDTWNIENKSRNGRIFVSNLQELVKVYGNQRKIAKTLEKHGWDYKKALPEIKENNPYEPIFNIIGISRSKKVPDLPKKATFVLDYSVDDGHVCKRNKNIDNHLISYKIRHNSKKWETIEHHILHVYLKGKEVTKISKPSYRKNKETGKIEGQVAISFKTPDRSSWENILGVDLGIIKPYSSTVVTPKGKYSQEIVPSQEIMRIADKIEKLYTEQRLLRNKHEKYLQACKNKKNNSNSHQKEKQFRREQQIEGISKKIIANKKHLTKLVGKEIVQICLDHKCGTVNLEKLSWLEYRGGKWNFSTMQQEIKTALAAEGIKVRKINPRDTSKTHPSLMIKGETKKRIVFFENGDKFDRDKIASLNIANKKTFQKNLTTIKNFRDKGTFTMKRKTTDKHSLKQILKNKNIPDFHSELCLPVGCLDSPSPDGRNCTLSIESE